MSKEWEIKKLGDIGKVSMCKRVFKEQTSASGDIPFYKIGTFGKEPDAFITKEVYNEFRKKYPFPKKGDVLISASGTIGRRVRYDGEPAYFQDSNIVWIDNDEKQLLNDYLYRFYEICNWQSTKGATISRLYNDNLRQIEIAFPKSLSEQQRIVSILDEAFAAIAKAKANTEKNLQNAKELFESYLQGVFANPEVGWEEKQLGEVLMKTETVDPTKNPNKEFIYLDVSSVNKETKEIENATVLLGKNAPSRARKLVKTNDVIFATVRPTHSRVALITEEYNQQVCSTGYFVLRSKDYLNNRLVFYFLLTRGFNKKMEKLQKGASYPAVPDSEVKGIYIPFPKSLKAQETIVKKLDTLSTETKKLQIIYQQKLNDLEELKKSILQKAFSGELKTLEKELA
jgi:type I restriction enzyme S subunit